MALKPPQACPGAPETRLDLISDKDAPGGAHPLHNGPQQPGRVAMDAVAGEDRVDDHAGEAEAVPFEVYDGAVDLLGKAFSGIAGGMAIGVGRRYHAHVGGERPARAGRRGDLGDGRRVAMVGGPRHDEAGSARAGLRDA